MNIKEMSIDDLKPYENNPRINDDAVDYVANSIEEFGFKVPIIIDENNVIVAGHTRLRAAQKLGLKVVPVVVADDLTPEQIKAFRLADNKTAEFSTWDYEKLGVEMQALETSDINMIDFGFEIEEPEPEHEAEETAVEENAEGEPEKKMHVCPKCGYEWE